MYSISLQKLAVRIPKVVEEWDHHDIAEWFQINEIQITLSQIQNKNLSGSTIKQMTPQDWITKFGCTLFIARRIVQWMEDQSGEFDQMVLNPDGNIEEEMPEMENLYILRNQSVQTNINHAIQQKALDQIKVGKWDKKENKQQSSQITNQYVKFIKSSIQGPYQEINHQSEKLLKVYWKQRQQTFISSDCKIGRHKNSGLLLSEESVSRYHAQIQVAKDPITQFPVKYCLKDAGSRFGTYVPTRGKREVNIGDSYQFYDNDIEITNIIIYNSPTNKGKVFDVKLKVNRQDNLISYQGKTSISIGKKGDLKLLNNCEGMLKIWLDKQRKLIVIETMDNSPLHVKLKNNQLWDFEQNLGDNNQANVIFGTFQVSFQLVQRCTVCLSTRCQCQ